MMNRISMILLITALASASHMARPREVAVRPTRNVLATLLD